MTTIKQSASRTLVGALALALGCAACSAPPETPISAQAGGSVSLGDEATLVVPAGSLTQDTRIQIDRLERIPSGPADGFVPFGQGYELSPHGTVFSLAQRAVFTVRVDEAAVAARGLDPRTVQLFHFDEEASRYVNVASALDEDGRLVAMVEHFSKYVLLAQAAALGNPGPTVTLQAPVPNLIRAGAPIFLRATVLPSPGTSIAAVRVYYRKVNGPPGYLYGVMTPDNTPSLPGTNNFGFTVPSSLLAAADLMPGNDLAYYAEATDSLGATRSLAATPTLVDVTRTYVPATLTSAPLSLDLAAGFEQWVPLSGIDNLAASFRMVSESLAVTDCPDTQPIGTAEDQHAGGIHFRARGACTGTIDVTAGGDAVSIPVTVRNGQVDSIALTRYEVIGGSEVRTSFDGTYQLPEGHELDLDALGRDAHGNAIHVNVSWQADPGIGTIDNAGRLYGLDGDGFGTVTASVGGVGGVTATQWFNVVPRTWTAKGAALNVNAPAVWGTGGALGLGRFAHTATRLSNDKVLLAGGHTNQPGGEVGWADIYDAATNTWSSAAHMSSARHNASSSRLPSGKVLVSGGHDGVQDLASAEIYDPAMNAWTATAAMTSAHQGHTQTPLLTGKVLAVGGYSATGVSTAAETYDPATNSWTAVGSMNVARYWHTATLLPDGTVLVAGGSDGVSDLSTAEIYDPMTTTWSPAAAMAQPRGAHAATLLPDGKVLVTGGGHPLGTKACEIYDPATDTWSAAADMNTLRGAHTATLLPNGKVLVTGGSHETSTHATAELYDPAKDTWTAVESMAVDRYGHSATLLANGRVVIAGGYSSQQGTVLVSTELFLGAQPAPRPAVAISGTVPYVAWHEAEAIANCVYVKHWDGTDWVRDGLAALNVDPTRNASFPRIALAGTTPYVAWEEQGATASRIQVKHWNGAAWVNDSVAGLNVNPARHATAVAIATSGGTPYIAWQEAGAAASQVHVRAWNGASFVQLGGSLNVNGANDASAPSIAVSGTTPYVAWQETRPGGDALYVKRWTGVAWVTVGAALNVDPAADAREPSLAMLGAVPYVTWRETLGGNTELYTAHWTGAAWVLDGPSFGNDATHTLGTPSIGFYNATPYVAWREELAGTSQIYVKHKNGVSWRANGGSLNINGAQGAYPPSVALAGPDPYVAWAEATGPTGSAYAVFVQLLE